MSLKVCHPGRASASCLMFFLSIFVSFKLSSVFNGSDCLQRGVGVLQTCIAVFSVRFSWVGVRGKVDMPLDYVPLRLVFWE